MSVSCCAATVPSCSATSQSVPSCCAATVSLCSTLSSCYVSSCSTTSVQSADSMLLLSAISATVPSHKSRSASSDSSNFSSCILDDTHETWCYCGQDESYDKMIACEYPGCEIEWFPYSCMGLTEDLITDRDWFCPDCQILCSNSETQDTTQELASYSAI